MKLVDRVKTTTTSTGTGAIACSASATSVEFQSLSVLSIGDTFPYAIGTAGVAEWETGVGTITAANTFSRVPSASSNAGALVNFSAGTKEVVCALNSGIVSKMNQSTSARVVYTSSICVSDSAVTMAPTTGADQSAKIQALLDLAASGPLHLVWDGVYSLSATLKPRSNTKVTALPGCGAVMLAASNVPMWRNYNATINPANVVDKNIEFVGGIWHGNLGTMTANDQVPLFDFYGIDNLRYNGGIEFRKSAGFACRATNATRVTVEDYIVDHGAGNTLVSTDGIHFNGPASHLRIARGKHFNGADDAIALNADDAWGYVASPTALDKSSGAITDVTIEDIDLQGYVCGLRLLSGGSRIDNVVIKNIKGKTGGYWIVTDNFAADPSKLITTGPGNIGALTIDGVRMENVAVNGWPPSNPAQAIFNCKIEQLVVRNVVKSKFLNVAYPAIQFGAGADIKQVLIEGYVGYPANGGTYLTEQIRALTGAKLGSLQVRGSMFEAASAVNGSPISVQVGATIGQLTLFGNSGNYFSGFVANAGTITNLHIPASANFMDNATSDTQAPTASAATVSNGAPTFVDVSMSEAMDTTFTPAAASIAVSGHTVTNVAWVSANVLRVTVSDAFVNGEAARTVAYTQPGTNNARDVAGNLLASFAGLAITNNTGSAGASTWALQANAPWTENTATPDQLSYVGPKAGVVASAKKTSADNFGGNVQMRSRIRFSGAAGVAHAAMIVRGSSMVPWSGVQNCYAVDVFLENGGGMKLFKAASGTQTNLGATLTVAWAFAVDYDFTLTAKTVNGTTTLSVSVQRVSDSLYLQTNGAWTANTAQAITVTDLSLPAASGEWGLYAYDEGPAAHTISYSNIAIASAP